MIKNNDNSFIFLLYIFVYVFFYIFINSFSVYFIRTNLYINYIILLLGLFGTLSLLEKKIKKINLIIFIILITHFILNFINIYLLYSQYNYGIFEKYYMNNGKQNYNSKAYGIKTPGIMAFLYFSGSKFFLFFNIFLISFNFILFEKYILKILSNPIFCCLIMQVIAYRFAHFGYLPKQSYLLFGSIILTIPTHLLPIKLRISLSAL